MEVIILDRLKINNEIDFFTMLCDQVSDFGDFFGYNLDAFNDYIGILGGKKIIWNNFYKTEKINNFVNSIIRIIEEYNEQVILHNLDKNTYYIELELN